MTTLLITLALMQAMGSARTDEARRLLLDWAGLTRYGSENTEIPSPAPGENRVVFLGDSNDLAGVTGPATEGTMAENFISMAELAKVNGVRVVFASVTPVCDCFTKQTALRPQGKIISLNGWIRDYAARSGSIYLDYYSSLADGRNFKKELTSDGLLPNDAGYAIMAPLAEKAIAEA